MTDQPAPYPPATMTPQAEPPKSRVEPQYRKERRAAAEAAAAVAAAAPSEPPT